MKIVKNSCFGGFSLSPEAQLAFLKRKGKEAFFYKQTKYQHRDGVSEYSRIEKPENGEMFYHVITRDLGEKTHTLPNGDDYFSSYDIERTDPDLIAVVEELGGGHRTGASGSCANLEIVEIPDGIEYEIDEYDGIETIREAHRSW